MLWIHERGILSKIREHVQSHQKRSSKERSRSSHKKAGQWDIPIHPWTGVSSDEEWSTGELEEEEEEDDDDEECSPSSGVSSDHSDLN